MENKCLHQIIKQWHLCPRFFQSHAHSCQLCWWAETQYDNLLDMTQNRVFVDHFHGSRNIHHRYKLVKWMIFDKLLFHCRAESISQQPQKQHTDSIWAEWNRSSISIIANTCVYPTSLLPKWLLGKNVHCL